MNVLSLSSFLSWRVGVFRRLQGTGPDTAPQGLDAFADEGPARAPAPAASAPSRRAQRWTIGALAVVALVEAPVAGLWLYEWFRQDTVRSTLVPRQPDVPRSVELAVPALPEATGPIATGPSHVTPDAATARATIDDPGRGSAALAVGGWVSVKTPVAMQVFEEDRLVGTTDVDRIMLPVGTHTLEIVSEALGYRSLQKVAIQAGKTSVLRPELPTAALAVNALPWAEVWVDGERVGETPIGNLTRTIGPHEVVFRHPDLGEKKETVVVTLKEPARIGVDLRSKS